MSANSVNSSHRRCSRRVVRDPARLKAALIFDLNSPPPSHPAALNALAAAAAEVEAASSSAPAAGGSAAPIDVEAIDEIDFLSSSRGFPEPRNQSRRRNQVILVIDEEQEVHSWRSVTSPHPNHSNKRSRIPPNRSIINCESYTSPEITETVPEPKKMKVPKEPTFSCPICIDKLVDPCSTVCGHIFCQNCLKNAVRSQKKCPTCRTKMTNKSFHRVFLPNATAG